MGRDPEDLEVLTGDLSRPHPDRRAVAGEGQTAAGERRHRLERGGLVVEVPEVGRRRRELREAGLRVLLHDQDQAFWLRVGQGLEQHALDHREDRGVGADTEGQGENGHQGEAGTLTQRSHPSAQVTPQRVQQLHSKPPKQVCSIVLLGLTTNPARGFWCRHVHLVRPGTQRQMHPVHQTCQAPLCRRAPSHSYDLRIDMHVHAVLY